MAQITAEMMQMAHRGAKDFIPEGWSVTLLVNPFGGRSQIGNYISDANRQDMIKVLREMADQIERGGDFPALGSPNQQN